MKELQDVYVQICECRECALPDGYCPQLRRPGRKYRPGGVVFVQINPGHTGSLTAREIERKYVREHDREIARRKATNTQRLVSLQSQFVKTPGDDTYETMRNAFFNSMSEHWGWRGSHHQTWENHQESLVNPSLSGYTRRKVKRYMPPMYPQPRTLAVVTAV